MGHSANKPILPWPALAVGALVAAAAVIIALFVMDGRGGNGVGGSPTPGPTPTLGPSITGMIGYITPGGDFALMDAYGNNQRSLTSDGAARSVTWSPDGSIAALEVGSGAAVAVRGVGPDGTVAFEIPGASQPHWSPGGDKLAVMQNSTLAVYDPSGDQLRSFDHAALPAWSPGGAALAFLKVADDGQAVPVIGELETGAEEPLAAGIQPAEPVFPIAWHPAGDVIAYRDHLYEPSTGTTTELPGTAVYWSPDGRILLVAGGFIPADNATPGLLLFASQGFEYKIGLSIRPSAEDIPPQLFIQKWTDWTPDGRYLFYLDPEPGRETRRLYDTVAIAQDRRTNIAGERPDVSPDGLTATFMYQDKVWVFPLDASALAAVADGGYPAWQPAP